MLFGSLCLLFLLLCLLKVQNCFLEIGRCYWTQIVSSINDNSIFSCRCLCASLSLLRRKSLSLLFLSAEDVDIGMAPFNCFIRSDVKNKKGMLYSY